MLHGPIIRLSCNPQKFLHAAGEIPTGFIKNALVAAGEFRIKAIINQAVVGFHVQDDPVTDKCQSHTIAGQAVGGHLLVDFQDNMGCKTVVTAEFVSPVSGVIAASQK